jgi:hypothetical protein
VMVWVWGWAQNPSTRAVKVLKVGLVKQGRKLASRSLRACASRDEVEQGRHEP